MSTALQSHSWPRRQNGPSLPDLSVYNNPANAPADFQRGLRIGRQAASRAKIQASWDLDTESFAMDIALEKVPLAQSMSFAFLKGFAASFRETYRVRCGLR